VLNLKFSHDFMFILYLISHGLTLSNILGWTEKHLKTCYDSQHEVCSMYLQKIFCVTILIYKCTLHAMYCTIFTIKTTMIIKIRELYQINCNSRHIL
jgi:hypothetical protein